MTVPTCKYWYIHIYPITHLTAVVIETDVVGARSHLVCVNGHLLAVEGDVAGLVVVHDTANAEGAVVVGAADVLDSLVTLAGDDAVGGHMAVPGPLPASGVTESWLCGPGVRGRGVRRGLGKNGRGRFAVLFLDVSYCDIVYIERHVS